MDEKCIFNLQQSYIIHNNTLRKGRSGKRGGEREKEKERKKGRRREGAVFPLRFPRFDVGEQLVARLAARLAAASVLSQGLIS